MDTAFLASFIPMFYLPPVEAYRDAALHRIVPAFDGLDGDAEAFGEAEFERLCSMPDSDGMCDIGDLAEQAGRRSIEYAETMFAIRQSTLNVLAVGLYHLFEQQQKSLYTQTYASRTGKVFGWEELNISLLLSGVDRTTLPGLNRIEELRLAANTIKHGSGPSATKLAAVRPDLFVLAPSTGEESFTAEQCRAAMRASEQPFAPLGGGDLFVSETDLANWCDAILKFWRGISATFWAQHFPDSEFPYGALGRVAGSR